MAGPDIAPTRATPNGVHTESERGTDHGPSPSPSSLAPPQRGARYVPYRRTRHASFGACHGVNCWISHYAIRAYYKHELLGGPLCDVSCGVCRAFRVTHHTATLGQACSPRGPARSGVSPQGDDAARMQGPGVRLWHTACRGLRDIGARPLAGGPTHRPWRGFVVCHSCALPAWSTCGNAHAYIRVYICVWCDVRASVVTSQRRSARRGRAAVVGGSGPMRGMSVLPVVHYMGR